MGEARPKEWIRCDESGKEMLSRVLSEIAFILPVPPLHRVPLRLGNVVEISGPSNSAKTQVLVQTVVHFILPKEWGGLQFGGLERKVVFFDLDCRFDVLRLSQILTHKIGQICGSIGETAFDKLFAECMNRFLYVRCYSSSEFLSSLKELHFQIQRKDDTVGTGVSALLIDRKNISLQCSQEAIVHELHELILLQPLLVLATKASLFRTENPNELQRSSVSNLSVERSHIFREYMPAVWQSFVTHRIQLHPSDELFSNGPNPKSSYTSEWLQPLINMKDRFMVKDDGIFLI